MLLSISILLVMLGITGCNNRENALLPPNLSAADYLEGNKIESYANYLVKSANDDGYLLLDKLAITDSLVQYGDVIDFRRVSSFASRDSLFLQDNASSISDTYSFGILRDGVPISLVGRIPLATVYIPISSGQSPKLINFSYYLQAKPINPVYYGNNRGYFPLYSSGEFCLYNILTNTQPSLNISTTTAAHALLQDEDGNELAINFPADYCNAAGEISLSINAELSPTESGTLQQWFPNAAIASVPISLGTSSPVGSAVAVLRLREAGKGYFGEQWVQLASGQAYSWQADNPESGNPNWWQDSGYLYSFVAGNGKYFLLHPLESQNELSISLDGSYNQVFLQDLWFDLNGMNLPNTVMKLQLSPDAASLMSRYFTGTPFKQQAGNAKFAISFYESGNLIRQLPDDNWLEFGFRTTLSPTANDRLFSCMVFEDEDIISYKTQADTYDEHHYTRTGSYVYTGISSSATYIYGSFTEASGSLSIPYYKARQYIQTSRASVGWNSSTRRGYDKLVLNLAPNLPSHPWLSGEPLQLSGAKALFECYFYSSDVPQPGLPGGFYLDLHAAPVTADLLLFNKLSYPRLKLYHKATALSDNSYINSGGVLRIAPEYPGSIISAGINQPNPLNLRVFGTMTFVLDELRLYTYGNAALEMSALFQITRKAALSDHYALLSDQYQLQQTSPAYELNTADEANYALFAPALFFSRSAKSDELLFYESGINPYRLYTYPHSSTFSPWAYTVDGSYNAIFPVYNGSYCSYTDLNPHNIVPKLITSNTGDVHLSLYQAQFVLPSFFVGPPVPIGSVIRLDKLSTLLGVNNLLAAYRLNITGNGGTALTPDFYSIPGATQEPFIYVPVSDPEAISTARMFYRNPAGQTTELSRVESFGENYANEYIVVGNSFICTVPNPGVFFVTR
jgi:hypothetical protein